MPSCIAIQHNKLSARRRPSAACRKHYLLRACAASFVGFLVGYLLMAVAPNIWLLLPATVRQPHMACLSFTPEEQPSTISSKWLWAPWT